MLWFRRLATNIPRATFPEHAMRIQSLLSVILLVAAGAGVTLALQPDAPAAKPAGLRVLQAGNSWGTEHSAPLCEAAGIVGHKKMNRHGASSPNSLEGVTQYLETGEVDAYVWQHSGGMPSFMTQLIELGGAKNPNFRFIIQQPWLVHDGRRDVKSAEEYENTNLDEYRVTLEKQRTQLEAEVDKLNAAAGRRVVFIVPLADGMLEVRRMIAAGRFPEVTKQSDGNSVLRGDIMPHQGLLATRLGAFMHFAALYKMSPEGLVFPGKDGDGLTEPQRAILQKLAWDLVSKYSHAGIAKPPEPGPAELNTPAAGG
jgi:hypothetical protein